MKNKKIVTKSCTHPISCIAYPHNEQELVNSLEALSDACGNIEYAYIFHYGEDGDKDHYHILIRNNSIKGFQNVQGLLKFFMHNCLSDIVVDNVVKFKAGESVCYIAQRQFIATNSLGDWYDYALHNKEYLEAKYNG